MTSEKDAYDELCGYTLSRGGVGFIHQHVVDAYIAQHADQQTKPIGLTFALVGLYLLAEKQWTGRQVQRAHIQLAQRKRTWPAFVLPSSRGSMTAVDVMQAAEGPERDAAILEWCKAVWATYEDNRETVVELLMQRGILRS